MGIIQRTVEEIIDVTKADYAKSQVLDLVMKLAREIGAKVLERYRGVENLPVAVADPNLRCDDEKRVMSHTRQILRELIGGPKTNVQLSRISLRVTARIHDARRMLRGTKWVIDSKRVGGGVWLYSLVRRLASSGEMPAAEK